MSADVLVTAASSFSHVAALVNPGCVVYQPMWRGPLAGWIAPSRDLWDVTLHKARPKFLSDEGLARYLAASQPA